MTVLVLAQKDLRAYRIVYPAALLVGLLTLAIPWIPGMDLAGAHPADSQLTAGMGMGVVFAAVMAFIHGLNGLSRDAADRRLGFYLARPVGLGTLYLGRILGGLGSAMLVGLCAWLPAMVVAAFQPNSGMRDALAVPGILLGLSLACLAVAQVWSHALLTRSPWLLLDAGALVASVLLTRAATLRLAVYTPWFPPYLLIQFLVAAYVIAALVASWAALRWGRTDLRRGHRALSLTLAGGLALTSLGLWIYADRHIEWDPRTLPEAAITAAPARGEWVGLQGLGSVHLANHGYTTGPRYLVHLPTGRSLRLPAELSHRNNLTFDGQGTRAAWLQPVPAFREHGQVRIQVADLTGPAPRIRSIGPDRFYGLDVDLCRLSPDGHHLAVVFDQRLTVYSVGLGTAILDRELPRQSARGLVFPDAEHVRIYRAPRMGNRKDIEILDFHLTTGRMQTGSLVNPGWPEELNGNSPDGTRVLMRSYQTSPRVPLPPLRLCDGRSGEAKAVIPNILKQGWRVARFHRDDRLMVIESDDETMVLRVFDRDGKPQARFDLPFSAQPANAPRGCYGIYGEDANGRLLVTMGPKKGFPSGRHILVLDPNSGQIAKRIEGLRPAWSRSWSWGQDAVPQEGDLATRLFHDAHYNLVYGELEGSKWVLHRASKDSVLAE